MKRLFPLLILLAGGIQAMACSFYPVSFCTLLEEVDEHTSILEFTILERLEHGIRVEINNVWYGQETRSELMIWDRETIYCNGGFPQETSRYGDVGTRVVAPLQLIDTLVSSWEQKGDYRGSIFAFTDGFLTLKGGRWKSDYHTRDDGVDIPKGYLGEFLSECVGEDLTPNASLSFFLSPNPASESVNIIRTWADDTEITVFDLSGRIVATDFFVIEEVELSLAGLNEGYYIVQVQTGNLILRKKLVIRK